MGLAGVIRGKPVRTTISDRSAPCPRDHVNRQFRVPAPDMLWISDFTYVATWAGLVYVAFVIDTFARRIVGRQAKGDWFNHRRLLEPIGNIPPAEAEAQTCAIIKQRPMAA